ncbi:MAG: hypothetical protein U9R74_18050 [Pseudomonadota bacterium]|nr:hypothetical protein [Pseudomonadota bacterium]
MDEDEFRATYHELNEHRCVFEKALASRVCACDRAHHFALADREGIACTSGASRTDCDSLLGLLRNASRFTLQLTRIDGPLPHAREIRVQNGGLLGLQHATSPDVQDTTRVENVAALVDEAKSIYGSLGQLPYDRIVKSVLAFQGRRKRSRKR